MVANGEESKNKKLDIDKEGFKKFAPLFAAFLVAPRVLCGAVSVAIYKFGDRALYDQNILALASSQKGYLYAAGFAFSFTVSWLNNFPMLYKSMVMRMNAGNLRANMQIFSQASKKDTEEPSYVVLESEGPIGQYNRANRSLHHFCENSLPVALNILLAGNVFPFPTFVSSLVFGLGRILHQVGYAWKGYGAHAPGFLITTLSAGTLEMLTFLVAMKNVGPFSRGIFGRV